MPNLLPTPALADAADLATRFGGSDGPDLTRYFTVCAILVVVTGLIAWGCRKLFVGTLKLRAAQRSLQTLDVLPLGGKQKLAVVRCYDRTFLVGLGSEVTPIAELDPVTTADQPRVPATKAGDAAFAQALEAVRRAMPKPLGSAPAPAPAPAPTAASEPKKKVVRRKVRKAPAAAAAAPSPERESRAASLTAAVQALARERATPVAAAPAPAPAPKPAPQAKPAVTPQVLRLEGVLG